MKLTFPPDFQFGTSTSAYQIETPFEHDWVGVAARDGHRFVDTTSHESQIEEDADLIANAAPHYRMSLMWSRLQREPYGQFEPEAVQHYHRLLSLLSEKNVSIMMVIHHFANPQWFASKGGWEKKQNILMWVDFGKKLVDEFGKYVHSWNTFNEPNLYVSMGWVAAEFPPFKKNIILANTVLRNIASAHAELYDYIKTRYPLAPVGISHNCTVFEGDNVLGRIPAAVMDWCYMHYAPALFSKIDFFGMSYYARIGHDPLPVTYITTPEKFTRNGKPHDDMWEYYPQGLLQCIERYWNRFKKPIVITENGICTGDDMKRIIAINDYLGYVHQAISKGIPVQGYFHWSTWDNFEWSLGPSYKFGLASCDVKTKRRERKPSFGHFSKIAHSHELNPEMKNDNDLHQRS